MISIISRSLQFLGYIAKVLQLALFLAFTNGSANAEGSSESSSVKLNNVVTSIQIQANLLPRWLKLLVAFIIIVIVLVLVIKHYRQKSGEKQSWNLLLADHLYTVFAPALTIGVAHYLLAMSLGHTLFVAILTVFVVAPMEHVTRRLLALPENIQKAVTALADQEAELKVQLPEKIQKAVADVIPKALDAKKIMVTGTLHSKNIQDMLAIIDDHKKFEESRNGISIFLFDATPDGYSVICQHFLNKATKIESMTDMELDKSLPLFKETKESVMDWVIKVNEKATNQESTIHRILVLTGERLEFLGALGKLSHLPEDKDARRVIESYSRLSSRQLYTAAKAQKVIANYIQIACAGLQNFKKYYCKSEGVKFSLLVKESEEIGGKYEYKCSTCKKHKSLPRGEFIMFDRKYLVRFNSEAELLEVYIGDLVSKFSEAFDSTYLLQLRDDGSFPDTREILSFMQEDTQKA